MKTRASRLTFALTAIALTAGAAGAAQAAPVAKNCKPPPTGLAFKASSANASTNSTTFVTVPETSINFTQGGSKPGCVVVFFSGLGGAGANGLLFFIRATIDGTAGLPAEVRWSGDDDEDNNGAYLRSRAMSFIFPSVAPGAHTLRIQYRSTGASSVQIQERNTIVYYVR